MKKRFFAIIVCIFIVLCFASCSSKSSIPGGSDGNNVVDMSSTNKIVYTVGYKLYSEDINTYISKIGTWVKEDGGHISESNQENNDYALYVYKVPTEKLNGFLDKVDSLSGVANKKIKTKDVTSTYNELEANIEMLEARKTAYLNLLNTGSLTKTEIIEINDALDEVEIKLIVAYKELAQLANQVNYSTVTINYYNNSNTAAYQFFNSYGGYLVSIFTTIGTVILYSLPFLLIGSIIIMIIIITKKKKKSE